jgi:hypothetical protein
MSPVVRGRVPGFGLAALLAIASATACTDVGDDSVGAQGPDATGPDVTASDDGSRGEDGDAPSTPNADAAGSQPDATLPEADGAASSQQDATLDSSTVDTGVKAETGAGEAGGRDASMDSSTVDAGVIDTGADVTSDTGAGEAGGQEAGGSSLVPCTTAGQTNCIACDQNASNLCTGTDAVIVQRDIEKGLTTGGKPSAGSCYECLAAQAFCIDSIGSQNNDCEDLSGFVANSTTYTLTQACLDTLNCLLGSPQAGTAGKSGTAGSLAATTCSNDPPPPGDGTANCFCGTAEPDFNNCSLADKLSAGTTGQGLGIDSPNGVCASVIVKALGATNNTSNLTLTNDLGDKTNAVGKAFLILNCGGATSEPVACPQCFE